MGRYAMVIDLRRCMGCNGCVVACKAEHNTPNGILCTAIHEKEVGKFPNVSRIFIPVLCNHCARPVCVEVCPTRASYVRADGVVLIDWDKCIGCRACIEACPYDSRHRVEDNRIVFSDGRTVFENPVFARIPKRVPIKCDFCVHRLDAGKRVTACAEVCPTRARIFGDLDDPQSPIHALITRQYSFRLHVEKGTDPQVYYVG